MVTKLLGSTRIKDSTKEGTLIERRSTNNGTRHSMTSPSTSRIQEKGHQVDRAGLEKDPKEEEKIFPVMEIIIEIEILTLVMGGINEETARRA